MPVFIAAIAGALLNITASIVGRVLLSLGIGVVAYAGINTSLTWLMGQAISNAAALPTELFQLLVFLKVGECISIISSAIVVRMLFTGLTSDTVKRWVIK